MRTGPSRRYWILLIAAVLVAGGSLLLIRTYRLAQVGSGYLAQTLCSGIFVTGHTLDDVLKRGLMGDRLERLSLFTPSVDAAERQVSTDLYGVAQQTSIFRDGLGCTLVHDKSATHLRAETADLFKPLPPAPDAPWPTGARVTAEPWSEDFTWPDGVDGAAATEAVEAIFSEPFPEHPRATRGLVVVRGGRIVAERYADGFDADAPLIGWSMSKAAINALVGLRVKDGAIALDDTALMPEWRDAGDPRSAISLDELMRMTSGLAFNEDHNDDLSDAARMLFLSPDMARFAADLPLETAPGADWAYSTGTTNIIAGVLRETFDDDRDYLRYPRDRLFGPLGMRSAVFAPDASGTLVGGAFMYASARDWARFGLLFLQDGKWGGEQLLPEGWVAYTTKPTPQSTDGEFGAQVWLKLQNAERGGEPPMPEDAYYMQGFNGQAVVIVPSRDLVVVRLGLTPRNGSWNTARELAPLVNAFPETPVSP